LPGIECRETFWSFFDVDMSAIPSGSNIESVLVTEEAVMGMGKPNFSYTEVSCNPSCLWQLSFFSRHFLPISVSEVNKLWIPTDTCLFTQFDLLVGSSCPQSKKRWIFWC
jgi:hypothetical protein